MGTYCVPGSLRTETDKIQTVPVAAHLTEGWWGVDTHMTMTTVQGGWRRLWEACWQPRAVPRESWLTRI